MKRHLKTHGRKVKSISGKTNTQVTSDYTSNHSDIVITKIEEQCDNSGGMSDDSNEERKGEMEASVTSLQFVNDPLESTRTL